MTSQTRSLGGWSLYCTHKLRFHRPGLMEDLMLQPCSGVVINGGNKLWLFTFLHLGIWPPPRNTRERKRLFSAVATVT